MIVIDLATQFDEKLWTQFQEYIVTSDDSLNDNYIGLDPTEFLSFPAVVVDDKIICFSGLQINNDRWGHGIGRCSARMWIHPDHRFKGMIKFTGGPKFLNTTHCLPIQLAVAKQHNLDYVFISREHNLRGFEQYLELIKINCETLFILDKRKYNVCGAQDPVPESCKQWVAVHDLKNNGFDLWSLYMRKYVL